MIDAVGIADQRVGKSSQIDQAVPFGIIARDPGDFETKHETHAGKRHLGGEAGKARTRHRARTGKAEILVNDVMRSSGQCGWKRRRSSGAAVSGARPKMVVNVLTCRI